MISTSDRDNAVQLINEAVASGASCKKACERLGITPSNSRSRVSNDNPYAESLFKTLRYRPNYQPKGFATLQEARDWVSQFVKWYNQEHNHSGLKFLTSEQKRSGHYKEILEQRHKVYEAAKEAHPERWNGRRTRNWDLQDIVYLNPEKELEETKIVSETEEAAS